MKFIDNFYQDIDNIVKRNDPEGKMGAAGKRKIILIHLITFACLLNLIPFCIIAFQKGIFWLWAFDLMTIIILTVCLLYLRKTGNHLLSGFIATYFCALLLSYLFASGGVYGTGHMWLYTFPVFSMSILGSRNGTIATFILFISCLLVASGYFHFTTRYHTEFLLRFFPSLLMVATFAYFIQKTTEGHEAEVHEKNIKLIESHNLLEQRVANRTRDLVKANDELREEFRRRQQIAEKLSESEERFHMIADTTDDILLLNDSKGKIIFANYAINKLLGYPENKIINSLALDLVHPDDREMIRIAMKNIPKGENLPLQEIRLLKQDGSFLEVEASGFAVTSKKEKNRGKFIGAILRDISERKKAEQEKFILEAKALSHAKLASLGEMATGVAHEINQPLSYIRVIFEATLQDIAQKQVSLEELIDDFKEALRQVSRIRVIIDHLQMFGRSDSLEHSSLQLESVLENSLILVNESLRVKNINLKQNIEQGLHPVNGNEAQLEQVFINMFQNSIHALKGKTKGNLEVAIYNDNEYVTIRFSDNGPGMSKELQGKIFEPFFTTKKVGEGTGLGLSIVYGIITDHNGNIRCESDPKQGTTFIISLPGHFV